jgi:hypothetical protein
MKKSQKNAGLGSGKKLILTQQNCTVFAVVAGKRRSNAVYLQTRV